MTRMWIIKCTNNRPLEIDNLNSYRSLPQLDIGSVASNIQHLTNSDVDLHMPFDVNFNYYDTHDFHNNHDIIECLHHSESFSAIHCNVRSLSANIENLTTMLSELHFSFSVISLTEIKQKIDKEPILNLNIPGYNFVSQPSHSNAGGVGFFIKDNLKYTIREDLSISEKLYEALWIEIESDQERNMLCGVIYRHPKGKLEPFFQYVNFSLQKIHREEKYCMISGDFNLELLKFGSHSETDEFLNILLTNFFQPHILQPTRITDHSATLIDNIFFNSLEHFTISGNVIYDIADHLANFLIIDKLSTLPNNIKIYKRNYSKLNEQALINEVQSSDWEETFAEVSNPTSLFESFYNKITRIVDKHIPVKELSKKEKKLQAKHG